MLPFYFSKGCTMEQFIQFLINGIAIGSIYALMTVGYSLVYSIMNFSNFAHGGVIMVGSYFGFFAITILRAPFWLALLIAMTGTMLLAIVIERLAYDPLRRRKAPALYYIISAMGISIFLENFVLATLGADFRNYPALFDSPAINIGNLSIGKLDLLILVVGAISLFGLMYLIEKTKIGLAIRATSFNLRASNLMGVNTELVIFVVFGLGGLLAGLAGVMYGLRYTVWPQMGLITNKAFVAAVFGGLGSLPGAIVGAIALGIIEVMATGYISSNLKDLIAFVVLILVLVIRPSGIMGKATEDKA